MINPPKKIFYKSHDMENCISQFFSEPRAQGSKRARWDVCQHSPQVKEMNEGSHYFSVFVDSCIHNGFLNNHISLNKKKTKQWCYELESRYCFSWRGQFYLGMTMSCRNNRSSKSDTSKKIVALELCSHHILRAKKSSFLASANYLLCSTRIIYNF